MTLAAADFAEFYRHVHGHAPFPWQEALTERVLGEGSWPSLVDVPTGLGKTSMLDVAVFVAAATAEHRGTERVGRRRILFVVDRRVVVDEAFEHAEKVADAINAGSSEPADSDNAITRIASALGSLGGARPGGVVGVTRMRGGTTWSSAWTDRPDRVEIVISTVDQVGSRLLFRGYGVSDRRKPIDAALVGTDALLLVDEAHLSTALLETAAAARARDEMGVPLPGLDIVQLTATPRRGGHDPADHAGRPFSIDLDRHRSVGEARERLEAPKAATLLESAPKDLPSVMASAALRLASSCAGSDRPVVLTVCNTIDTARRVHAALTRATSQPDGTQSTDLYLLIGRSRPVDRAGVDRAIRERFGVAAARTDRPAVLVATQTVEVGINLDVDGLVTESASWDALVQRLGRLNRLGRHAQRFPGAGPARAVVVHDGQTEGPVYGSARDATWEQLCRIVEPVTDVADLEESAGLPVAPLQCRDLTEGLPLDAFMAPIGTPILTTPILDTWVRTAPVPQPDPPIEPYLHGFRSGSASVTLAWRDGLLRPDDSVDHEHAQAEWDDLTVNALLAAAPVRAGEKVDVPLAAVRRWMSGQSAIPVSDLEGGLEPDLPGRDQRPPFEALVWREDASRGGSWRWSEHRDLRPGDQVLVPAERGGLDRFGWDPSATGPVTDVSEAAAVDVDRLALRVDATLARRLGLGERHTTAVNQLVRALAGGPAAADPGEAASDDEGEVVALDAPSALVRALASGMAAADARTEPDSPWAVVDRREHLLHLLSRAGTAGVLHLVHVRPQVDALLVGELASPPLETLLTWHPPKNGRKAAILLDREDDDVLATSVRAPGAGRVSLTQHLNNVRARAEEIAARLGLPPEITAVVADAAGWHDIGKVEERFQAMLHGGDPYQALVAAEPLAKSGLDPEDRAAWLIARSRSELPAGARHEAWSSALLQSYLAELVDPYPYDADLLLHLVATHHGHARPLLPLVVDHAPRAVEGEIDGVKVASWSSDTVDLDQPGRFSRLNARYGRWGLAFLETIVRCADMTVSTEGS